MSPSKFSKCGRLFFLSVYFIAGILFLSILCGFKTGYAQKLMYTIQLGAYKNVENAQKQVESLKMLGHNAFYLFEDAEGEIALYRVYIERFSNKEDAEKEAKVLSELNLISDYTIGVIGEPTREKNDIVQPLPDFDMAGESYSFIGGQGGYCLHVSSLRDEKNADELTARLRKSSLDAVCRYETNEIGGWYRIYIEGYGSEKEAFERAEELKGSGIISYYKVMNKVEETTGAVESTGSDENVFFLHISSYKEKNNADDQVLELEKQGYKVFSLEEEVEGESWHRVYIGEFFSMDQARKKGVELKGAKRIKYFKPIEIKADAEGE